MELPDHHRAAGPDEALDHVEFDDLLREVARRLAPALTLGLALAIYLVAVIGLFVLALLLRAFGHGDLVRPAGVALGILTVVVTWTVALLVVHVRHDRGPRAGGGRGRRRDRPGSAPDRPRKPV